MMPILRTFTMERSGLHCRAVYRVEWSFEEGQLPDMHTGNEVLRAEKDHKTGYLQQEERACVQVEGGEWTAV